MQKRRPKNWRYGPHHSCWRKKRHEHAGSALEHATQLHHITGYTYWMYFCRFCEGIHVGRQRKLQFKLLQAVEAIERELANVNRIVGHENFWAKAPEHVHIKMLRIKHELEGDLLFFEDVRSTTKHDKMATERPAVLSA